MLDLEKTFSTYFKSIESGITKLKSGFDDISNRISNMAVELALFRSNFNAYRSDVAGYVNNIISSIDTVSQYLVDIIFQNNNFHQAMGEYFGFDIIFNPDGDDVENWFTHSIKSTFKEVLLDVYHTIDNYTNPQSEDNKVAFEAALTNVKDNTFIGSAYEVVDTVPNDIKNALITDSSPVLTFTSAGVKGKYYSLPAKSYSIYFSWYAPFKSVGDTVVSCFMYLGFLVALWKRLPEIIHGSGVTFVGGVEFHENQLNDMINETMANDYYEHLKANGGYDDIDDF